MEVWSAGEMFCTTDHVSLPLDHVADHDNKLWDHIVDHEDSPLDQVEDQEDSPLDLVGEVHDSDIKDYVETCMQTCFMNRDMGGGDMGHHETSNVKDTGCYHNYKLKEEKLDAQTEQLETAINKIGIDRSDAINSSVTFCSRYDQISPAHGISTANEALEGNFAKSLSSKISGIAAPDPMSDLTCIALPDNITGRAILPQNSKYSHDRNDISDHSKYSHDRNNISDHTYELKDHTDFCISAEETLAQVTFVSTNINQTFQNNEAQNLTVGEEFLSLLQSVPKIDNSIDGENIHLADDNNYNNKEDQTDHAALDLRVPSVRKRKLERVDSLEDMFEDTKYAKVIFEEIKKSLAHFEVEQAMAWLSRGDTCALQHKAADVIAISSDEDDVMCADDEDENMDTEDDPNNSGSHVNDAMNQLDGQGRVLVNVGHPPDEPDIFLAPQLARTVKPHQIGGIRFLYDNLVESLERYKTSNGFGCILAHSMGLGKTIQVISFIDIFLRYSDAHTVLCIVPINTLQNWVSEFNMWIPKEEDISKDNADEVFARSFPVFVVNDNHKTTHARASVIEDWCTKGGVLLMGYEMYRLLSSRRGHIAKPKRSKKGETLVIDVEEEDKNRGLLTDIHQALIRPGPDLVICDEGHRIKNAHASTSQALKSIRTRRRVVLTGYPLQNNLMEYWCMVDFVRPNFLGNKTEFSNMFERPIMNGQCADSTPQDVRLMRFRAHVLHSLLEGFVQRRGHAVLRAALPPKEEYVLFVRLSPVQKKLYSEFMSQSDSLFMSLANNNPLKAFAVCCKIWNHPDTLFHMMKSQRTTDENDLDLFADADGGSKKKGKNAKNKTSNGTAAPPAEDGLLIDKKEPQTISYEWAERLLEDYETGIVENGGKMVLMFEIIKQAMALGDKCLIFSQSLLTLNLIEEFLGKHTIPIAGCTEKWAKNKNYFRLDGSTSGCDREKLINQFNVPYQNKFHLFLLSTRAGCLGINLIGANRVIIFDASWNPCHDCQAVCRVYRYGQQKCCYVYRLVSNNTMEKKIYDRQINKQGMSDRVVDEMNIQNNFTRRQVESLLTYDDVEVPQINTQGCEYRFPDKVIISCLRNHSYWITKEPFTHESLLIDRKDQRLTKMEKRLAKQSYEEEKKLKISFSRPSYAAYYPKNAGHMPAHIPSRQFAGISEPMFSWMAQRQNNNPAFLPALSSTRDRHRYAQLPNPNRPVASVRPIMSTPLPMQLKTQSGEGGTHMAMQNLQRPGVFVQQIQTTTDISIPGTVSTTEAGGRTKIPAGENVLVIKTPKGVYIRTTEGKIFAVRSAGSKYDGLSLPGADGLSGAAAACSASSGLTSSSATASMSRGGGSSPFPGMYSSSGPWMGSQAYQSGMYQNMMSPGMPNMYPRNMMSPKQAKPNTKQPTSKARHDADKNTSSPVTVSTQSQSSANNADNNDTDSKDSLSKDGPQSPDVHASKDKPKPSSSGISNMGMAFPGGGGFIPSFSQGYGMNTYHMGMMPNIQSTLRQNSGLDSSDNNSQDSDSYASSSQGLMSGGKTFIPTNSAANAFNFSQNLPASSKRQFSEKFPVAKQGLESLLSLSSKKYSSKSRGDKLSSGSGHSETPNTMSSLLSGDSSMNSEDAMFPPSPLDNLAFSDNSLNRRGDLIKPSSPASSQLSSGPLLHQHQKTHLQQHSHNSQPQNFSRLNDSNKEYPAFSGSTVSPSDNPPSFSSNMAAYRFPFGYPSNVFMPNHGNIQDNRLGNRAELSQYAINQSCSGSDLPELSKSGMLQTLPDLPSASHSPI